MVKILRERSRPYSKKTYPQTVLISSRATDPKTYCPECGELLATRAGYVCKTPGMCDGRVCGKCGRKIEGVF